MSDTNTTNGRSKRRDRGKRGPGPGSVRFLVLADIDHRTAAYRKTTELIASIEGDLGGADRLSTGERQLIQRAAITGALLEDQEARWLAGQPIDPALYATLGNAQRRLFETVGLRRQPRDVTPKLSSYLANAHAEGGE
jgi:hypothetical protein